MRAWSSPVGKREAKSAFRWKDYEVTATKQASKWWKKAKATTSRKRCWEKSGELKGSRDWGLCLASDARGSYAVAGCRGGDLKLWRPPKAEQSGINRWVEAGVAERSHDSSRMRSDVRAVAVDDNSDTDWCRLWDRWYGLVRKVHGTRVVYKARARWET